MTKDRKKNKDFAILSYLGGSNTFILATTGRVCSRNVFRFEEGIEGNPNEDKAYYSYDLIVFRHAPTDINKSQVQEAMVQKRDKGKT